MHNYTRLVLLLSLALQCDSGMAEPYAYRLGPGDEIQIQVYDENDLSMRLRVDESGTFNYPYLGTVTANGRTVVELEKRLIAGLLEDVLVKPNVNVSITSYRNFYIGGEVKKPGGYPYQPGLTILQAMTVAGGPTEWASSSKFRILKEGASEAVPANKKTLVRPGDTVTILEGIF